MSMFRTGAVIAAALGILAGPRLGLTATAALSAGEAAPAFSLPDVKGAAYQFDKSSAQIRLLVFAKPGDRYATETLAGLNELLKEPDIEPKGGIGRLIILSRLKETTQTKPLIGAAGPGWKVLLDQDDRAYRDYKIIVTPTILLIGSSGRIAVANPGYDSAMTKRVRDGLLALQGRAASHPASMPAPYMPLQIARHLAARRLWDNALVYYKQAEREGRLPVEGRLEMAEMYLEMNQLAKAKEILDAVQVPPELSERKTALLNRALKAKKQTRAPKTDGT